MIPKLSLQVHEEIHSQMVKKNIPRRSLRFISRTVECTLDKTFLFQQLEEGIPIDGAMLTINADPFGGAETTSNTLINLFDEHCCQKRAKIRRSLSSEKIEEIVKETFGSTLEIQKENNIWLQDGSRQLVEGRKVIALSDYGMTYTIFINCVEDGSVDYAYSVLV
ncbi:MAG: hypothetical protein K940chlam3_01143 [Chlamydiae bacterium]|nr:hypothetical protein [Chlamydiota bacterium]